MLQAQQILEVLSEQLDPIREFFGPTFETIETHWCIADARLTAFRGGQMWALAFEFVGYCPGADDFENRVFLCGSHLSEIDSLMGELTRPVLSVPDAWNTRFKKGVWGVTAQKFAVRWQGKRFDFAPKLEEWEKHGILLSRGEKAGGHLAPETMLRFLCEEWNHPFFLSDGELRALLDEKSFQSSWEYDEPNDRSFFQFSGEDWREEWEEFPLPSLVLEKVLQTREWRHPIVEGGDYENNEWGWGVSPREAFGVLSEILAGAEVSLWETQDKTRFNSDWRLYTESAGVNERKADEGREEEEQYLRDYLQNLPPKSRLEFVRGLLPTVQESVGGINALFEQNEPFVGLSYASFLSIEGENGVPSFQISISPDTLAILEKLERELKSAQANS